jgi:hypothetical protein
VNRAVAVAAVLALAVAAGALTLAIMNRPQAPQFPLTCSGPHFTSPQTGTVPTYFACSTIPPWRSSP